MAVEFRDEWLESFYVDDRGHKKYLQLLKVLCFENYKFWMQRHRNRT